MRWERLAPWAKAEPGLPSSAKPQTGRADCRLGFERVWPGRGCRGTAGTLLYYAMCWGFEFGYARVQLVIGGCGQCCCLSTFLQRHMAQGTSQDAGCQIGRNAQYVRTLAASIGGICAVGRATGMKATYTRSQQQSRPCTARVHACLAGHEVDDHNGMRWHDYRVKRSNRGSAAQSS